MLKAAQVPAGFAEVGEKGPSLGMIAVSSTQRSASSSDPLNPECRYILPLLACSATSSRHFVRASASR
jgi:hypothetical protein